jgi:CBS domain-containing protein
MLVERLLPEARTHLVTIPAAAPLIEAARLLGAGTDLVVVCDASGILSGVITKTDVVGQMSRCQGASCVAPASVVMTRDVVSCRPSDWLADAWAAMKRRQLKNLPIVDEGPRPLGVLTARAALQGLLNEVENEETLLRDYVMSVGYR